MDPLLLFPTLYVECSALGQICFAPEATSPLDDPMQPHDHKHHSHQRKAESEDSDTLLPTEHVCLDGPCYGWVFQKHTETEFGMQEAY